MPTVTSQDGTPISYRTSGDGPPLVLVVGAFCDASSTAELTPRLTDAFTVVEYDRRGRGSSGNTAPWSAEREIEDLTAVSAAASAAVSTEAGAPGAPVALYGHSSGAALALLAAAAGLPVRAVAAYEAPWTAADDGTGGPSELLAQVQARLADDDPDGAAVAFVTGTGMPPQAIEGMRRSPWWPTAVRLAPTLEYDLRLLDDGTVPRERLARITAPVLALAGGDGAGWAAHAAAAVADAVPDGRARVLEGQTHQVAPDAVAPVLRSFFAERVPA